MQAAQLEEHIGSDAKNSARTALAQIAKVEMLSQAENRNGIKPRFIMAQEPTPGEFVRELHRQRTRLQSARSEITTQHSNERSPDHSAGDIKFGAKEMPDTGIGSTKIHPSPHFSLPESFFFDVDEIELESGQNPWRCNISPGIP